MVFESSSSGSTRKRRTPPPTQEPPPPPPDQNQPVRWSASRNSNSNGDMVETLVSILGDAGCTLCSIGGQPLLPADSHKFIRRLESRFSDDPLLLSCFLSALQHYIRDTDNLRRVLTTMGDDGICRGVGGLMQKRESLIRLLLLVPPLQLHLQILLLEKLPEHFHEVVDVDDRNHHQNHQLHGTKRTRVDVARMIINQFLWLDFLVDPDSFSEKLLEVLEICPLSLKKEIIRVLPQIVGDWNNTKLVTALERMLQEDHDVILPVLDSLSNLNLDHQLQDQVINIVLSCIRTIDAYHMPHLLRFLLVSATSKNIKRIISTIREEVKLIGMPDPNVARNEKWKGKSIAKSYEASIVNALGTSIRFNNVICDEILKELKNLKQTSDHKVIDVWLLVLIYSNGGSLQKNAEKILIKKITEGLIQKTLLFQCIYGQKELVKDFFSTYLCICEFLLACKDNRARDFAAHFYIFLFEEFTDTYSKQEILGALIAHIGSGSHREVNSALDTLISLTSKYSKELVPLSSYINGILDYLETFNDENLQKVYEVFCQLALFVHSDVDPLCSSIAKDLLMIVRKQVGHPDMRYKRMGIAGILKIVSKLGSTDTAITVSLSHNSNTEVLELLKTSLESCKLSTLSLILLYDELVSLIGSTTLLPSILDWLGKHVRQFECNFLTDLEGGELPRKDLSVFLQGELWMNLDGEISPVCVNVMGLISSSQECSTTLQILPVQFMLLSTVERFANEGSLEGMDALLGCPIHLPATKYIKSLWNSLSVSNKTMISISLYYAINWIREVLNAFSTQIASGMKSVTQAAKEEILLKLLKRLRNLIFMEGLLNLLLKQHPITLPEVQNYVEHSRSPCLPKVFSQHAKQKYGSEVAQGTFKNTRKSRKKYAQQKLDINERLRQPTLFEVLKKGGAVNEKPPAECSIASTSKTSYNVESCNSDELGVADVSVVPLFLDGQKSKFRPLLVDCLSLLSFYQAQDTCCSDSAAQLPLHLFLLRDFNYKLECLSSSGRPSSHTLRASSGLNRMTILEFLNKVRVLFPSMRRHLEVAVCVLQEGAVSCQNHWMSQSTSAGNPDIICLDSSRSSSAELVCNEVLLCLRKLLKFPELFKPKGMPILKDLLESFQPVGDFAKICIDIQPIPSYGSLDYLYCGTYFYIQSFMEKACIFSFSLAAEFLFSLESVVHSISLLVGKLADETGNSACIEFSQEVNLYLQKRLGISAQNVLGHDWNNEENRLKIKGEAVQKILCIYLSNSESTSDLLSDLACSVLPQQLGTSLLLAKRQHFILTPTACCGVQTIKNTVNRLPTLCEPFLVNCYRVLHEENLNILRKLVEEMMNYKGDVQCLNSENILTRLCQLVDVVVSLVTTCKTNDKVLVHRMAIKYGGKFVDIFLKAFNFFETHFQMHADIIIQMVRELQKATRILQTLCSEAKVSKCTIMTGKVPATKRSLERFLFHVKALLHNTSNRSTFWMGSLKHKDLLGQVVSSQPYVEGEVKDHEAHDPSVEDQLDS